MKNTMMKVVEMEADKKNFKLIPIHNDCPYVEVRFDLEKKHLLIMSKTTYDAFKMMPKLDDAGQVMYTKPTAKVQQPMAKYERLRTVNFYDYNLTDRADIEKMVTYLTSEYDATVNLDEYFVVKEKPKKEKEGIPATDESTKDGAK